MKVIDNFLDYNSFNNLQKTILGDNFDWYYNPYVNTKNDKKGNFQFIHFLFKDNIGTNKFPLILPILNKIKIKSLLNVKVNLITKTKKIIEHGFHVDYDENNLTTSIFYLNTCNGYTKFKNNKIIKSKANRLLSFDSSLEHSGTSCTDENIRAVINLNYF